MKILTIVGARPNFIKIDPLLKQTIVHTGQHYDFRMSKIFFNGLKLPKPAYNLGCTDVGQMIDKLRKIIVKEKPEMVLVFGDTNSAMAGAMAASLENVRVAHIEAGLRSYDISMPEEKNRIVIDKIASLLFCPNNQSALNLLKEGISNNVHIVGDPLFDSMGRFMPIKKSKDYRKYSVLTTHRNFNVDNQENLRNIVEAIGESKEKFIFPVHPRTAKMLKKLKIKLPKNIKLKQPLGYKETLHLISNANKVVTDSGGIQREAFWMNVPVILLRDNTEWVEIVGKRAGVLVGTDKHKILDAINNFKGSVNAPPEPGVNARIRAILYKNL